MTPTNTVQKELTSVNCMAKDCWNDVEFDSIVPSMSDTTTETISVVALILYPMLYEA